MKNKLTLSEALLVLLLSKVNDPRDMALVSNLSVEEIQDVLKDLVEKGLVFSRKTGFIIKRVVYDLTSQGYDKALEIYASIRNDVALIKELLDNNRIEEARVFISRYSNVIWLLKTLKLVDDNLLKLVL